MSQTAETGKVSDTPVEELTYEQAYGELEEIVAQLETEDQALENALALYERGRALAGRCARLLETAELRVREHTD